MLDNDGSYLLEVMVGKENNVFPMVPQGQEWRKLCCVRKKCEEGEMKNEK